MCTEEPRLNTWALPAPLNDDDDDYDDDYDNDDDDDDNDAHKLAEISGIKGPQRP